MNHEQKHLNNKASGSQREDQSHISSVKPENVYFLNVNKLLHIGEFHQLTAIGE